MRRIASALSLSFLQVVVATSTAAIVHARQNHPPDAPVITEPSSGDVIRNPADVHMETAPFSDQDPGDQHLCTDWEIWRVAPSERVWHADGMTGVERVHVHLGDGIFENSHAGATALAANTDFSLHVRHSDDSGDPATQWSPWSTQFFRTGLASQVPPLELDDVASVPAPRWIAATDGSDVVLQPASPPPRLYLGSAAGDLLLAIEPGDGVTNSVANPVALATGVPVRVELQGGSQGLTLPPTDLRFLDTHCGRHAVLLPAVTIAAGETQVFWVSADGATYAGTSGDSSPDFAIPIRVLSPPWNPRREGFRVDVFASGFKLPVNLAFVPHPGPNPDDPFFYVTELQGVIKVVARDGSVGTYASDLLDFTSSDAFPGAGEQGLAGIAVDPATGDVFASMLHASPVNPSDHFPKIDRFTSQDGGRTAATRTTILDMANEIQGQSHQISNLLIDPAGKLFCHMGDGFTASAAEDLDSFRGKILRLELDGSPVSDNPFYDAGDGISARDYVFAYGLRNPFGGGWRAADGKHYEVEAGPNVDRFAQVVAGRDFGWNDTDASMQTAAIYNWSPAHAPVNLAFVQPETFGGSGFPQTFMGHVFVTESGPTYSTGPQDRGRRITEFVLDEAGALVAGPIPFLEYAGRGKATMCGLAAGPDGLYATELYADEAIGPAEAGANILRIRFAPESDCNGNEVEDACDIASGASLDANGNGMPDECEWSAVAFCFGDGSSVPCPCGNSGLPGHGCQNSTAGTGGALLTANGSALLAADTLQLVSSGERSSAFTLFWQARAERPPTVQGDGISCLAGSLKRLFYRTAVGGVAIAPQGSELSVSARSAALGDPISPGTTRVYHAFYRDPDPAFCPPPAGSTFNASNGLRVVWGQ